MKKDDLKQSLYWIVIERLRQQHASGTYIVGTKGKYGYMIYPLILWDTELLSETGIASSPYEEFYAHRAVHCQDCGVYWTAFLNSEDTDDDVGADGVCLCVPCFRKRFEKMTRKHVLTAIEMIDAERATAGQKGS